MSESSNFETLDFKDLSSSFRSRESAPFSPTVLLREKLLRNIKQMISVLIAKDFFFCRLFTREESKSQ